MYTWQQNRVAWYNKAISYFIIDIAWALLCCLLVYQINNDNITVITLSVWFVTLVFFWQTSSVPIKFFSQSYRHPVRLIFSVTIVVLIYFFLLRADYSITSLIYISILWLLGAFGLRLLSDKYKPAQRVLGHPLVLNKFILNTHNICEKITCEDPANIRLNNFDCVVFDPQFNYSKSWQEFFVHISTIGVPIFSLSELHELVHGKVPVEVLQKSWIDQSFVFNRFYLKLKRIFDVLLIIIFSPVILFISFIIASLIKIFMGGRVIYSQKRVGLAGESFVLYKFRSMIDLNKSKLETQGKSDPRITKLGSILRLFRLDELPQLYNVLLGQMSIIGPRPEWQETADKFAKEIPLYQLRHIIRPGLTGWAQVQQGHTIGVTGNHEKLRYDLYYIKHCSFWLDCKIVLKTIKIMLFGKGI